MVNTFEYFLKEILSYLLKKTLWITISIVLITILVRYFIRKHNLHSLSKKVRALRKKIYDNWPNNPGINLIRIQKEITIYLPDHNSCEVYVKRMALYPSKNSPKVKHKAIREDNPFLPPFPEGAFIDNLSQTHSLIYNGNSLMRCHCLVITKEFVSQSDPLNSIDFEACLLTMKAIRGFVYYNSGPNAGSSQKHKHLQVVPYGTFRYGYIPIEDLTKMQEKISGNLKGKKFTIPQFKFKHIFYMFPEQLTGDLTEELLKTRAMQIQKIYLELLHELNNDDRKIDYNVILTNKWIFIVLRKQELAKGTIKVNAMSFTGSFVIRNDQEFDLIPQDMPFDILLDVTFQK